MPTTRATYAQWVRSAVKRLSSTDGRAISLFDSSVAEPVEILRELIERNFQAPITSRYQSVFTESNPYVVEALASRYRIPAENILCTTGATGAISLLYRTLLNPGDHIVVETPGFDIFSDIAASLGVDVGTFERRPPEYRIDAEAVATSLRPNSRLIVLSNLHNPSGMRADDDALISLGEIAAAHGAKVIVDEVYRDYVDIGARASAASMLHPNLISVSSLTKIYGLSALRCGWIAASSEILEIARSVSDKFEFGVSKLAHAIAALVLESRESFDEFTRRIVDDARPLMEDYFNYLESEGLIDGQLPEFGCICFPRVVGVKDTSALSDWLAARHGVIVTPGEYFGAAGYLRIGFGHEPDELKAGLSRFSEGLRAYREMQTKRASAR